MEEQKPKFDWKHLLITTAIVIVAAGAVGGTTYYVLNQNFQKERDANEEALTSTKKTATPATTAKAEVPLDYTSVVLNGATIYYPKSFGSPKMENTKASGGELTPGTTFDGAYAAFGDYSASFSVYNASSYSVYPGYKSVVDYLKRVYDEKQVSPEDVLALGARGRLPMPNAIVWAYNPRYVQSANGNWRGYWYISHISQGFTADLTFTAVMTNKEKVLTIEKKLTSAQIDKLKADLEKVSNNELQSWELKRDEYAKSAYAQDSEITSEVNGTMLKITSLVK